MIIWLNETFGAGKTTTAKELTALLTGSRIFDTEHVGLMLNHVLASEKVDDFQDWPPWRGLVVATATNSSDASTPIPSKRVHASGGWIISTRTRQPAAHTVNLPSAARQLTIPGFLADRHQSLSRDQAFN